MSSSSPAETSVSDDITHQLALDVLAIAEAGGMPDTFWQSDSRIARACAVLGLSPDDARTLTRSA